MAYKQKPMSFGEGTGLKDLTGTKDKGSKFNGLKTIKPPRANSIESEEKEQEIENKANDPGSVPLFSDDAHDKVKKKALNKASNKSKKIKPSFPATLEGSKKRAAAEKTLEAKEDAKGL